MENRSSQPSHAQVVDRNHLTLSAKPCLWIFTQFTLAYVVWPSGCPVGYMYFTWIFVHFCSSRFQATINIQIYCKNFNPNSPDYMTTALVWKGTCLDTPALVYLSYTHWEVTVTILHAFWCSKRTDWFFTSARAICLGEGLAAWNLIILCWTLTHKLVLGAHTLWSAVLLKAHVSCLEGVWSRPDFSEYWAA